jgi:fumarate reductase flavoprotein subunit
LKANILENIHTGEGIQMAFDAGADSEGLGKLLLHGPVAQARSIFGLAIEADTVWVNTNGERFIQESASFSPFESANGVLRQPGQVMFSLFDEAIVQRAIRNGLERPFESSIHSSFDKTKLRLAIDDEIAKGNLASSASLDELAIKMEINPTDLKNNVEEYNSCCDRGHDDQLAKDRRNLKALRNPPYYATRCVPGILSSLGGIKTNHRMEVLDKQNNPIAGFYAAGNDACGGFSGETYNVRLAGAGCGFAFNSGRIAGENAAKHTTK